MPSKKKHIKHTARAPHPSMRLKPPRLRTSHARKHQSPSKRTAHKELIISTPKVEEITEVDEKYKVEKLREDKLTQSPLNEPKVKEISVETSIKKEETLDSDQPLRRPKEIKAHSECA